jgi:hypothetical protein
MAFSGRTDENSCQLLLDQCQDFMKHLHSAVNLAGEHIDAFLLVINVNKRFTRESSFLIDALEEIGIEYDHIVVVFTEAGAHGKTQEERKKNVSKMLDRPETRQCGLKKLIEDVNERYVVVESVKHFEDDSYRDTIIDTLITNVKAAVTMENARYKAIRQDWELTQAFLQETQDNQVKIQQKVAHYAELSKKKEWTEQNMTKCKEAEHAIDKLIDSTCCGVDKGEVRTNTASAMEKAKNVAAGAETTVKNLQTENSKLQERLER